MTHAAREITVGRADAFHRRVHATERIDWSTEARGAAGVFGHLHACVDEDLPDGLIAPTRGLEVVNDFRRGGNAEGVDDDFFAAKHAGEFEEVARFAAGAGTDVGAIKLGVAHGLGELALAWIRMAG